MIPKIITFRKSMTCRLQEYQDLFGDTESPCSDVKEIWAEVFNEFVIPRFGWQALWIMSEKSCKKYDVLYPTAVIVRVTDWCLEEMCATVTVIAVQDDIVLPSSTDVPIIELHPMKEQEYDEDYLKDIADWLDKCRFFFKYLWYPSDEKINVELKEWCHTNLKNRLQIHYDIENNIIDKRVVNYFNSLVYEAREIMDEISTCDNSSDLENRDRVKVFHLCIRLKVLEMELNFLEDPDLRCDLMRYKNKEKGCTKENSGKEAKIVWGGGSVQEFITHLEKIQSRTCGYTVKVSPSLQDALENSLAGDPVFLCPGSHSLKSLAELELGGSVEGIINPNDTQIVNDSYGTKKAILFQCFGDFTLQGVTVSRPVGIIIQQYEGTLEISNCRLVSEKTRTTRAVVVVSGSRLIMKNCEVVGFGVGIVVQKGATASLYNTRIYDCFEGLKMSEESTVELKEVEISSCFDYGIRLQSSKLESDTSVPGDLDLLSKYVGVGCNLNYQSLVMKDNQKYNVVVEKDSNYETVFCELNDTNNTSGDDNDEEMSSD